ncbi:hypothetical protein B566_EDAN015955, partial [Ephemera danica]
DPPVCRVWQRVIRRDEKKCAQLSKYSKVCSSHFQPDDFLTSPFIKKKCLKPQAVPSVFTWKAVKRRRHLSRPSTVPNQDKSLDSVNCVVDLDETLPEFVKLGGSYRVFGRGFTLAIRPFTMFKDEVLLVHSKLRQDLDNVDLAFRFGISKQLVDFKREYPTTILILDATEVKTEIASSLVRQSQTYSTYKSNTTVKALVGTDLNGSIIFVSQLFTGSISDKEICKQSHIFDMLKEKIQCGEILPKDNIMVDKEFAIKDEIAELGLELNIPLLAFNDQFEVDEAVLVSKIASKRIVVEQAIRKIKAYKIFSGTVKINNLAHLNQVFTVCSILKCFRPTTRND